ncbi:agamous-like MADS-box protein AGL80 [Brachypodium distachyon]|nr:agamous-like MADS-box protein AGL80 [Brachypodium distachyon]|eukprot:XP_003560112.1 agamous-like MADS-box protein AGL80 [Brachypodium distachyon]
MARRKVNLRRIQDPAARRTTFRKRRDGLMKKASELATLCNLKACVIVYGEGEAQPHVWPSVSEAVPILRRYKDTPDLERYKKTMSQEGFLRQRVDKLREMTEKLQRENHERQTMCLLHKAMLGKLPTSMDLTIEEVTSVGWMAQNYLKSIGYRIAELRGQASLQAPPATSIPSCNDMMTKGMGEPSLEEYLQMPQHEMWIDNMRVQGEDLSAGLYSDNGAGPSTTHLSDEDLISWAQGFDFDASSSFFTPM